MKTLKKAVLCLAACLFLLPSGCANQETTQTDSSRMESTSQSVSGESSSFAQEVSTPGEEPSRLVEDEESAPASSTPSNPAPETASESPERQGSQVEGEDPAPKEEWALEDLQDGQGDFIAPDLEYGMPSLLFLQQKGLPLTGSGMVWNVPAVGDQPGYTLNRYPVCQVELLGNLFQYTAVFKEKSLDSMELDLQAGPEEDLQSLYQQLYEEQKELYGIDQEWEVGPSMDAAGRVVADRTILYASQESEGEFSTYLQGTVHELEGRIIEIQLTMGLSE